LRPAFAGPAAAQTYPSRTVSIVVPYPAGGSVDGVARIVAQKLAENLGQSVIVENRAGGAGGIVGANYVAKAAPDGYTLMLTASIHVITPFLAKAMPYDVVKDFAPISLVAVGPLIVSTAPGVPAGNLRDLFAQVRKTPDKFTFATSSFGSAGHLAIELLKRDAGVDTLVIAYKGAGPMLTDVMSGQVHSSSIPSCRRCRSPSPARSRPRGHQQQARDGGAGNPDRRGIRHDRIRFRLLVRAVGPKACRRTSRRSCRRRPPRFVAQPAVKERMALLGFEPIGSTTAYFAKYIDDEMAKYARIIKDANIKAE